MRVLLAYMCLFLLAVWALMAMASVPWCEVTDLRCQLQVLLEVHP